MNKRFETMEVMRALGVMPSTASIIANLMSGKVDPDNFRSIECWAMAEFDVPPPFLKVLTAIAELMELDPGDVKRVEDFEGKPLWYLDGMGGQPTVTWHEGEFTLREVDM